jgi:hypothetical protein
MLPLPADVSFHLAPALFLTLDLLFLSPPWATTPRATFLSLLISTVLAFAYWFWVELCYRSVHHIQYFL